jgi:glycosyltransferase involved in cell wall biosynthesis
MQDAAPARLDFDVVIATRNRADALALSIPLLLGQSRVPRRLIVIDSSDDHAPVAAAVARATAGHPVEVIVEHGPPGAARQRNQGLRHVTADIVFFPDDDSLCHPGTTAAIMEVYERDTEGRVAAVNPADTLEPPPGVLEAAAYDMTAAHKRMARTVRARTALGRLMPEVNPRFVIGRILMARAPQLPWLAAIDAVPVEWMTGYRMSFRTAALKAVGGFEGIFGGYSLFEDTDASWAVTDAGCVVGANRGRIYHHRFP